MSQVLHIFRKDVRQHWASVAISLAMLAGFAWRESRLLTAGESDPAASLLGLLVPLLPFSWFFLILRVVQDESLVGDRQFWLTRPYEWKKLLLAKVLFVLAFVNLPFFIAQCVLLATVGYAPGAYLSGLLWLQLLWTVVLFLPTATLATITTNVGAGVLVAFGSLLCLMVASMPLVYISNNRLSAIQGPLEWLPFAVALATGIFVVVRQYARRKTTQSRILIVVMAIAVFLIPALVPTGKWIARAYPHASPGRQAPVQFAFDPAGLKSHEGPPVEKNTVHLRIPLLVSGIPQDSMMVVDGTMFTVEPSGGPSWTSQWSGSGGALLPSDRSFDVSLSLERSVFEKLRSTPLNVRLSLAITPRKEKEVQQIVAARQGFTVPGDGYCAFLDGRGAVECLFPLRHPFSLVSVSSQDITCAARQNEPPIPAGTIGYARLWSFSSSPAEFALSPVRPAFLFFRQDQLPLRVCPGTPLRFSTLEPMPRLQTELIIEGLRLADYQLTDFSRGSTGFGIGIFH